MRFIVFVGLIFLSLASHAKPFYYQSFEEGLKNGSSSEELVWSDTSPVKVARTDDNRAATHGDHSLRFTYRPGQNWIEQRFTLTTPRPELWFRFWIRVPSNFVHADVSPHNNKFFSLWMDDYSNKGEGPTIWWSYWHAGNGNSKLSFAWNEGGYQTSKGNTQYVDFIQIPRDRGRWMQMVLRVRAASHKAAHDGALEAWRRWEGETQFTRLHGRTNLDIPPPARGPQGWARGYLLGWASATFDETTTWYVDEFTVSTTSLLEPEGKAPPAAPSLKVK